MIGGESMAHGSEILRGMSRLHPKLYFFLRPRSAFPRKPPQTATLLLSPPFALASYPRSQAIPISCGRAGPAPCTKTVMIQQDGAGIKGAGFSGVSFYCIISMYRSSND